jgi:2-iminobutanoate/2-iminopropanoate deaminase
MRRVYGSSESTSAPISSAWEINGLLFISGQIHADENWILVGGTVEERFAVIMQRVETILKEGDLSRQDIFQLRIYLTDISELPILNEVYKKYFQHPLPVRTAMEVK